MLNAPVDSMSNVPVTSMSRLAPALKSISPTDVRSTSAPAEIKASAAADRVKSPADVLKFEDAPASMLTALDIKTSNVAPSKSCAGESTLNVSASAPICTLDVPPAEPSVMMKRFA